MKRKLAAILACTLAVSALAGCGTTGTNTTKGTEGQIADAKVELSADLVETEKGVGLHEIPVEDYVFLGEYKNLALSVAAKKEYTEEEVDEYVKDSFGAELSYADTSVFETKGTVADGDYVLIDYKGKKDGIAFDGGTASDQILRIGSEDFIDGFEDGLVGAKVGETLDLNLTFPKDYNNTDLAGKAVVFTVTVKGLLQYSDKAVAKLGYVDIETMDAYREAVAAMMEYNAESAYHQELTFAICDALLTNCPVSKIPSNYFEEQKEYVIEQVEAEASMYGTDGDTYTYAFMGVNLADYALTVAEEYTKQAVIFQAIANVEELNPTKEDIDAYVTDFVAMYGESVGVASEEDFYKVYSEDEIRVILMQDNVINFLSEKAKITEK